MPMTVLAVLAGLAAQAAAPTPPAAAVPSVVATPTPKNSWVVVAAGPASGTAYDAGSIRRGPDGASAYISTLFASKAALSRDGAPVHFLISQNEYDCKIPRRREGAVLALDATGKPVGAEETVGAWQAIAPKSAEAGYQALACQSATPDAKIAEGGLKEVVAEFRKRFAL